MSWGRRLRRPVRPVLPLGVSLTLPPGAPLDMVELARLASTEGARLLEGLRPDRVGLVVVHPDSPSCPDRFAGQGRALVRVESLSKVVRLARLAGLRHEPDGERFSAVLLGVAHKAALTLEAA